MFSYFIFFFLMMCPFLCQIHPKCPAFFCWLYFIPSMLSDNPQQSIIWQLSDPMSDEQNSCMQFIFPSYNFVQAEDGFLQVQACNWVFAKEVLCIGDLLASLYVESHLANDVSLWPEEVLSRRMNKTTMQYSSHYTMISI